MKTRSTIAMLLAVLAMLVTPTAADTVTFQQGVAGYTSTVDTWIGGANPDTDYSTSTVVEWDGEDGGSANFGLLRFDDIFGTGSGQVAPGEKIR